MKGNKEVWVLRQLLILNRNANLFTLSPPNIPCTKKRACRAILGDKTQFNSIFVKKRDKQKTPLSTQPSFYPDCLKLHCKPHKRKIYTQLNGKKHPKQARGMLLQINIPRRNRGVFITYKKASVITEALQNSRQSLFIYQFRYDVFHNMKHFFRPVQTQPFIRAVGVFVPGKNIGGGQPAEGKLGAVRTAAHLG